MDEIIYRSVKTEYNEEENKIIGYAAKYDSPSEEMWSWLGTYREYIDNGAFEGVLKKGDDVRCLFNHDDNQVIGRTSNGTLKLEADKIGLYFECEYDPEITWHADLVKSLKRGDINQCSFAFTLSKDDFEDSYDEENDVLIRHIKGFDHLYDVSVVTRPAYPQTEAYARDLLSDFKKRREEELNNNQSLQAQSDIDRLQLEIDCL